jgi:hypothetical protein
MTPYSGITKHFPWITFTCVVFWGIVPWTLVDRGACCLHLCVLKMEAAGCSETLIPISQTAWHRIKMNNFIATAVRTLHLRFALFYAFYSEDRTHFPTRSGLSAVRGASSENRVIINGFCWFSNKPVSVSFSIRRGYVSHDGLIFECGYFLQKDYPLWFYRLCYRTMHHTCVHHY